MVRNITEIIFFTLLGSLPLIALICYGQHPWQSVKTRPYLILGYVSYGIAVLFNSTRFIKDWYALAGAYFDTVITKGELIAPVFWNRYYLHHHLMDYLVEESLELIGAGALFAAAVAYQREYDI